MTAIEGSPRGKIVAVCRGVARDFPASETASTPAWRSAIAKSSTDEVVRVFSRGLDGDEQADRRHHGGPDQALLMYSADHYAGWRAEFDLSEFPHGAFGENLTILGLTEEAVCIGDVFRVGNATARVTMPRFPCWKLARRWNVGSLTERARETGRVGWYLGVVEEGEVHSGEELILLERPHEQWSVARVHALMHHDLSDQESARELSVLDALSETWRSIFAERVS